MMRLDDKITLIAGVSQYMGPAFTRTFTDAGAIVVTQDRTRAEAEPHVEATAPAPAIPTRLLVTVALSTTDPGALNAWYTEEHLPLLHAIPGWDRTVRYCRREGAGPDLLAVQELADNSVFDTDAYRYATSTPRRSDVMRTATTRERRLFSHHRSITA
jgi:hypothetical protein